ncbi:MAG: T9SS type A sorting domain-containing protein [Porphyromonadaceae bacterium]|nr:T9SS type A sorting domain-containing protein [Porphyromonadaceae bacterium]
MKKVFLLTLLAFIAVLWNTSKAQTTYNLIVGGVQVTSDNASSITGPNITGLISYDDATKTLTLDNVTINATGHRGIYNKGIQGLTIKVLNNNSIETDSQNTGITLEGSATINGGGTLTIRSKNMGIYLRANQTVLTLEGGTTLDAEGTYCITGKSGKVGETLIVRKSILKAKGSNCSIVDLAALTLEGCKIEQPVGAEFNPTTKRVELNGQKVTEQVLIMPKTNSAIVVNNNKGIKVWSVDGMLHIKANENVSLQNLQIYNISGQLVRNIETSGSETRVLLPTGTYIIKAGNVIEKVIVK